ncbi:MAG: hypothetical protein WC707_06250 [Candidatus Babeliaceae bacterium]|jgi:K+-transporting ATPase A subunit
MNINATLILQIINFCIAYQIIDKIFLKYAVALIQRHEALEQDLIKSRESCIYEVRELNQQAHQAWQRYQAILKHNVPPHTNINCVPLEFAQHQPEMYLLSHKEMLVAETITTLFNKIRSPHG